jgi:hypothetical protein
LCLGVSASAAAQASTDAKYKILGTVIAEQAAARIPMPFGADGFEITDSGVIDQKKIEAAIKKNGQSIEPGKVVTITAIDFSDDKIEVELDGGGKNKKAWYDRIEVGMGSTTTPVKKDETSKAKGSKIVLKFANKVPADITPEELHKLLDPALDFEKHNFLQTGLESLPKEYQEAVKAKEARIGMDRSTVIMAMGRADKHFFDKDDNGNPQETWIYYGRGMRATFIWFQNDVVVKIEAF